MLVTNIGSEEEYKSSLKAQLEAENFKVNGDMPISKMEKELKRIRDKK